MMMHAKTVYIALGSNKGNKFENLQQAVDLIFEKIGAVKSISKIYQTKALGFDGEDFFNACMEVETHLPAQEVLKTLLLIENRLGRERTDGVGYQSRTLDLDLLFYGDEVLKTTDLIVPHPEIPNRQFVLKPLMDIASGFLHPVLEKTVLELQLVSEDQSQPEPVSIWLKNPRNTFDFHQYNYIAIEGNIGAGKTSLATQISNDFNAKLVLERFADNPFLPKFYEDAKRYAFTLEMSFLADRYQQISDDLSQFDLFKDFIVSDYDIFKSLIFSKITLAEDEFKLYRKLFYLMYKEIAKPDLYVYLYQNTERLQQNIKKRGRDYEQNIQDDYLERIHAGYLEFLKNHKEVNVKIIDVSDKDFVANRADYLWVINEICHDVSV